MKRTTLLEAVNSMLIRVAESPVNSLTSNTFAVTAAALLQEISKEVQIEGWRFNTDYDVDLSPNSESFIFISPDIVRVDPRKEYQTDLSVSIRNNRLYNKTNRNFIFENPIKVSIVKLLPFEDCPEAFNRYVTMRAARVFANSVVGAPELDRYLQEEEAKSRAVLMNAEVADRDINLMTSYPDNNFRTHRTSDVITRRFI